jgi:hypothetical protein
MVISINKLLTYLYKLLNEGKEDEAWQKIAKWEQSEPLTTEENHKYKIFKGSLLYLTGRIIAIIHILLFNRIEVNSFFLYLYLMLQVLYLLNILLL